MGWVELAAVRLSWADGEGRAVSAHEPDGNMMCCVWIEVYCSVGWCHNYIWAI